jgi:hypothetical protein
MSRTIGIIITAVTAMLCGIPALGLTCFGTYMIASARTPSLMDGSKSSPELILLTGVMIAVFGLAILLLIAGVGYFSIRFSRPGQPAVDGSEEIPPLP